MSADQITPEAVARIRETLNTDWDFPIRRIVTKDNVRALLDAIEAAWAERDTLRAEVQRLRDEARRSDAGRVEVPDLPSDVLSRIEQDHSCDEWDGRAHAITEWFRSRLSPSPQPSSNVVVVPREKTINVLGFTIKNGCSSKSCHVAKPMQGTNGPCSCIPGFVSVPTKIKIIAALRSSTNHDAQDAGEGR